MPRRKKSNTASEQSSRAEMIRQTAKSMGKTVRPRDVIAALKEKGVTVSPSLVSKTLKAAGMKRKSRGKKAAASTSSSPERQQSRTDPADRSVNSEAHSSARHHCSFEGTRRRSFVCSSQLDFKSGWAASETPTSQGWCQVRWNSDRGKRLESGCPDRRQIADREGGRRRECPSGDQCAEEVAVGAVTREKRDHRVSGMQLKLRATDALG